MQEASSVTTTSANQIGWFDRSPLHYAFIFLVSFVILFLGMDRGFDFHDEGLILVGAMRVAAGQVPHRNFYANYGPGQFYPLASLFDLFGPSVLVERLYDLTLRSAIATVVYGITAVRYIVLESQYDSQVQPWNDSSKSSGVTLLDDYIRRTYRRVEEWGGIWVWLRQGAQP